MRTILFWLTLTAAALFFSGCTGRTASEQALIDQNNSLGTQIAALRQTATVASDLLLATLDQAGTDVGRVSTQQSRMIATLQARGMFVATVDPLLATATPNPAAPALTVQPAAPTPFFTPTPLANTGLTPLATTPLAQDGAPLSGIVASTGVGSDDCAVGTTSTFSTTTPEIYIVALATGIQDGTVITSRWLQEGAQVAVFDFTYGFIERACIWFFATPGDFAFSVGNYSVTLEVNGVVAGQVNFTIQ